MAAVAVVQNRQVPLADPLFRVSVVRETREYVPVISSVMARQVTVWREEVLPGQLEVTSALLLQIGKALDPACAEQPVVLPEDQRLKMVVCVGDRALESVSRLNAIRARYDQCSLGDVGVQLYLFWKNALSANAIYRFLREEMGIDEGVPQPAPYPPPNSCVIL